MSSITSDCCPFHNLSENILQDLTGKHVIDSISCNKIVFKELTDLTRTKFDTHKKKYKNSPFSGLIISQNEDYILLNQKHYA